MAKRVGGVFNGTGAAVYLGIGFVPDWVTVYNMEDADVAKLEWNKNMLRTAEMTAGRLTHTAAGLLGDPRTVANLGVVPYRGGENIAAASTTRLVADRADKRDAGTLGTINRWTLGSAANRTGSFNAGCNTTYVGEGSEIVIREDVTRKLIKCALVALTNDGDAANEVTLSEAVKGGEILFIGNMYDYVGAAAGTVMPDGFGITATDVINVANEMCAFEAGTYE
jgi:hypothetical protein